MKTIKLYTASIVLAGIILMNFSTFAQKFPVVKSSEKGILVYPGKVIPKNACYKIERSIGGQNNFRAIAMLTSPKSFAEFAGLVKAYSPLFSYNKTQDSATIKNVWEEFNKNNETTEMMGMINLPLMYAALGMAYYDTNVVANQPYIYRVSLIKNGKEEPSAISEGLSYPVKANIENILLYNAQPYQDHILIYWYITGKNKPYNFNVYRQEVSKREYRKVSAEKGFNNHGDSLFLIVNDKWVNKDENYNYYIEPIDYYGNKGNNSEIVRVAASSVNSLPVITKFDVKTSAKKDGLQLKWKFDRIKYLRSISIYKSDNFDNNFIKLAEVPVEDSIYIDRGVLQGKSYYYYLVINGLNNKTSPSAKVSGFYSTDLKPFPPQVLKFENVQNGYKLSWQCIEENIMGFLVYRCEGIKGKMTQISGIVKKTEPRTVYFDTSATLGRKSYSYTVKTISKGFTESIFSDTVSVFPTTSKEPPAMPARLSGRFYNNSVLLIWDNMYKMNPYLAGYNVYRKEKKDKEYKRITDELIISTKNSFTDTNISQGQEYIYAVESVDIFANKSEKSFPVSVVVNSSLPISASGIKLYNLDDGISVNWDAPLQLNLVSYKVYRYSEKGDTKLIYTAKPDEMKFVDKDVKKDELYFYYVTSSDKFGNESEPANEVSLRR